MNLDFKFSQSRQKILDQFFYERNFSSLISILGNVSKIINLIRYNF